MIWAAAGIAFVGSAIVVLALVYAFTSWNQPAAARLYRLWFPQAAKQEVPFKEKQK